MKKLYLKAKKEYYAGTPIMTDLEFDTLEDQLREKYPNWKPLIATGYKGKKEKTKLPCYLPSLSKRYPEDLAKFKPKGEYIVSDKLDGSAVALQLDNGKPIGLFTRGDGEYGGDISFLLPYLKFPKSKYSGIIRMEAIMPIAKYNKRYAETYDSARNLVAGILNRTLENINKKELLDIDFVALGVINESLCELGTLDKLGFLTVKRRESSHETLLEDLPKYLLASSKYEKDGLVVIGKKQKLKYKDSKRPKFTFAYKDNQEALNAQSTVVLDLEWQVSSKGRLTPRARIKPVKFGNVVVRYVTANNAVWAKNIGLGIGAKVKVVRSGEVIPKIIEVVQEGVFTPPSVPYTEQGVHFIAVKQTREMEAKQVERFLVSCGVENVRLGSIEKIKVSPTIVNYVRLANYSWERVKKAFLPLGNKAGKQAYQALAPLKEIEIVAALDGWNQFGDGVGRTRLEIISNKYGLLNILEGKYTGELTAEGIGKITAKRLQTGIAMFGKTLYPKLKPYLVETLKKQEVIEGRFTGKLARWTGYRSKEEEAKWISEGGLVAKGQKNLDYVFYKEGGRVSSTLKKAGDKAVLFKTLMGNFNA